MKFVSLVNSVLAKARRNITQGLSAGVVTDEAAKDPAKVQEQLRQVMLRVNKLEAAAGPEPTEFEVNLPDTGELVELPHGFKTTFVRWSVVGWFCQPGTQSPSAPPSLVYDPSSTSISLFLRSYVKGRAIIRVEQAQQFVDPGPTLDLTDTQLFPRVPFGYQRRRVQIAGIASTTLATVTIPLNSVCIFRTNVIGKNQTTTTTSLRESVIWSCYRLAGNVTDLVATVSHSVAVAGMTYTFTVSGGDLILAVQCTTAAQTVDWSVAIDPVHIYLTSEPL